MRSDVLLAMLIILGDPTGVLLHQGDGRHACQATGGLNESVLESLAARYRTYLEERRYASQTRHIYLSCVTHFARWATSIGDSPTRIDEAAIARFLNEHLPRCTCPRVLFDVFILIIDLP